MDKAKSKPESNMSKARVTLPAIVMLLLISGAIHVLARAANAGALLEGFGLHAPSIVSVTVTATPTCCNAVSGTIDNYCDGSGNPYHYTFGLTNSCSITTTGSGGLSFQVAPSSTGPWTSPIHGDYFNYPIPPGYSESGGSLWSGPLPAGNNWWRYGLYLSGSCWVVNVTGPPQPSCLGGGATPVTATRTATREPATATPTCSPLGAWSIRPETYPAPAYLYGVDVISPNDAWAVGDYQAQHWDGATWTPASLPSPGSGFNTLYGVAALAANDVWAVGTFYNNGGQYQTLTEHWNGSSWSVVPSPNQGTLGSELHAVAAVSHNDVWAVGTSGCCNLTNTLIEHWNGAAWTIVPSPSPGLYENRLLGVASISANDVWAVGWSRNSTNSPTLTLIMHWDGGAWTIVPSPNQGSYTDLNSVMAVSSNDVWAVGLGVTMHWDGAAWTIIPSPGGSLYSVDAISSNDVWAVGYGGPGPPIDHPWSIHWNGSAWSVVPVPDPGGLINELHGVAAVSGGDVWAVGWSTYSPRPGTSLIEHYSSLPCTTVTVTPPPNTPTPTNTPVAPTHTAPVPSNTALAATPTSTITTTCTISFTDVPSGSTFYEHIRCLACRGIVSGYSDGTFRPNNEVTRGQLSKIVSGAAAFTEDPNPQIFADVPPSSTFYEWINRLARRGIMSGYPCGGPGEPCINNMPYFRPFANATRGQTSKIVAGAAYITQEPSGQTFEDVSPAHPFYRWIEQLTSQGVMGGYPCGGPGEPCLSGKPYFRPQNNVTRGQSAKIVANTFFPGCTTPGR